MWGRIQSKERKRKGVVRRGGHSSWLAREEEADILKQMQKAVSQFCLEPTCIMATGHCLWLKLQLQNPLFQEDPLSPSASPATLALRCQRWMRNDSSRMLLLTGKMLKPRGHQAGLLTNPPGQLVSLFSSVNLSWDGDAKFSGQVLIVEKLFPASSDNCSYVFHSSVSEGAIHPVVLRKTLLYLTLLKGHYVTISEQLHSLHFSLQFGKFILNEKEWWVNNV